MKAVIMCGGKGTRMRPLTYETPKCLIPVNGKPFLYYVIERMKRAGYSEFGIVYMDRKEQWDKFLVNYQVNATLIPQPEPKGTADAVSVSKDFVGLEDFVVVNGDNLYGVEDYKALNKENEFCYAGGMKSDTPEKYGVIFEEDGFLRKIVEKPQEYIGDFVNIGVYKFTKDVFDALGRVELSPRGELELTDALTLLGSEGKVKVVPVKDMVDFGGIDNIPVVEEYVKKEF